MSTRTSNFMSLREIQDFYGISESSARRLIRNSKIEKHIIGVRSVRYLRNDVEKLREHKSDSPGE